MMAAGPRGMALALAAMCVVGSARGWSPPGLPMRPAIRMPLRRAPLAPVSDVRATLFDVQTIRDTWDQAAQMVVNRAAAFIGANILATLAWRGLSRAMIEARDRVLPPPTPPPRATGRAGRTGAADAFDPPPVTTVAPEQWLKLIPCIIIDLGGDASYFLPFIGDVGDAVWAPTSAVLLRSLFSSNLVAGVDFVKEALPGTDIIPVATIAWFIETFASDSELAKKLGLSKTATQPSSSDAVDVTPEPPTVQGQLPGLRDGSSMPGTGSAGSGSTRASDRSSENRRQR